MERYTYRVHTPDKSEPKPDSEIKLSEPIGLKTREQLVDFFSTYAKLQKDPIKFLPDVESWVQEKADKALSEMQAREENEENKNKFPQSHYFGVYDGDKMVGTGEVEISRKKNKKKSAYLCHLTVDPGYRTKQVSIRLGEVQAELAKREGCEFMTALINTRNLPIIKQALNNGFYIGEVINYRKKEPRWSEFKIFKKVDEQIQDGNLDKVSEVVQVPLFNIEDIENRLNEGFVGTKLVEVEQADVEIGKTVYEYGDVRKYALELEKI